MSASVALHCNIMLQLQLSLRNLSALQFASESRKTTVANFLKHTCEVPINWNQYLGFGGNVSSQ